MIRIIILLVIIVLFNLSKPREKFTLTDEDTIKKLYQMLYDIDKILLKNNIKYYIDGGTLLGAVRHKGIIPWDDDGDLCIFKKDIKNFLDCRNELLEKGYIITKYWAGYKIFHKDGKEINYKNANWGWYYYDDKTTQDIEIPDYAYYEY